ncbi:MAG: hypothetical protein ACI9W4_000378 [Rhodothermales bacterium]|jgi:hypothetical protein
MIRVLFIILAVVSMVLAFVLSISWLYLVSAGMLIGAAVILTLDTRKRLRRTAVAGSRPVTVSEPKDDLKSFGIMEIRPVQKAHPSASKEENGWPAQRMPPTGPLARESVRVDRASQSSELGPGTRVSHSEPDEKNTETEAMNVNQDSAVLGEARPHISGVGVVRKRARTPKIMVEGVSETLRGDVVLSVLRGLRSALSATTVTLLRQEKAPLGYSVEAMVSQNSFARSGGHFTVAKLLVTAGATLEPIITRCNGPKGFNARRLGYYHEPIAINKVAFITLTTGEHPYLLVCDSMSPEAFEDEDADRLMRDFGRLVKSLVSDATDSEPTRSPAGALRPRREIIAEEMSNARGLAEPLALALVHLESELSDSDKTAAERVLAQRLASSSLEARVERFGDLTFGVMHRKSADDAARWASVLLQRFREDPSGLVGGLSVGVAIMSDRHKGADLLRADATSALRESYETGECIILE